MITELLHIKATRLLYRVLAPSHPRGRTDIHAVIESDRGGTLWVHTHGLRKLDLYEIEFVGVPGELRGHAHGILFDIMGYMKAEKPIGPDEHIGGAFVHPEQRAGHYATSRLIERPNDPPHSGVLRFVDYMQPAESGFPAKLFAAHILALSDRERSPSARERAARLALRLHPGDRPDPESEGSPDRNPGNWASWDTLGHALCDQGKVEEGLRCFEEVVRRCPAAALRMAEIFDEAVAAGALPPPGTDPRSSFWLGLDRAALRAALANHTGRAG